LDITDVNIINKDTKALISACKEVCQEMKVEIIKYMLLSSRLTTRQNQDVKFSRAFESISQFNRLETTVKNQNLMQ
jgi:hypothetical protein